jgi:hypothetical protein
VRSCSSPARLMILALNLAALSACRDQRDLFEPPPDLTPQAAVGDVFTVTNTNDAGVGSLRWALGFTTGGEIIRFDPALAGQTITVDSPLVLTRSVTIEGPPGEGIVISGGGRVRVFRLLHTGIATLRNLAITGGKAPANESGGAMHGTGNTVLENSAVYGNEADAVAAILGGPLKLVNSTISGNTSIQGPPGAGVAVLSIDRLELINSTVAHNSHGGIGGGDLLIMRNSIVSNNGAGLNCGGFGARTFEGKNLSDDDSCGGPTGSLIGNPLLAPLADNGGPTRTHALSVGSPAINAGTDCTVAVDQRGVARDAQCDLGAFEFIDFTTVALTIDASAPVKRSNGWAVVTGTVKCSRNETFDLIVELEQTQKAGQTTTVVRAAGTTPIACGTTLKPWSASLAPSNGSFAIGSATADARTANTEGWVTPAAASRSVKLFQGRK